VTKVFIVFVSVLSLVLSALTIAYAANADRVRGSLSEARAQVAEKTTSLNLIQQQSSQDIASKQETINTLRNQLSEKDRAVASLQSERTNLKSEVVKSQNEATTIRNQIAQLGATADTQAALIKKYADDVEKYRDELLKASTREIELVDRINDLESQREVLDQNARALREQLEEAKIALANAQQGITGATPAATAALARELPGPVVRARVAEVFRSPAGEDMIVISEGANRGLRENILLNVVRGGTFVGTVTLTTVEPQRAVGKVNYLSTGMKATIDDQVLSRLN
jgi:predicted  nucleic acid-binding Zn-ribbon protein